MDKLLINKYGNKVLYDTETNEIYKAYNGFTDDYTGERYQTITDNMYTEKVTGYIEKQKDRQK